MKCGSCRASVVEMLNADRMNLAGEIACLWLSLRENLEIAKISERSWCCLVRLRKNFEQPSLQAANRHVPASYGTHEDPRELLVSFF